MTSIPTSPTTPNGTETIVSDSVKDVTLANFKAEVLEASLKRPVIVDFWAPWCSPCKQLGPLLEKLVRSQKGAVSMVKIDIDRDPEIAQQMRVQSIPAVFAFFQGQPIDGFMGALPESQLKAWIEKLIKTTGATSIGDENSGLTTALKQAADFLGLGEASTAKSIYEDILEMAPDNIEALSGALRSMLALNETEKARQMLGGLPAEITKDKIFDSVRTALDLAEQASGALAGLAEYQDKVKLNPDDHQSRYDLAMSYYASGNIEESIDALLEIVRRNRKWNDEAARKQLVKLFEVLGPTDPLTIAARKRLSSILFS